MSHVTSLFTKREGREIAKPNTRCLKSIVKDNAGMDRRKRGPYKKQKVEVGYQIISARVVLHALLDQRKAIKRVVDFMTSLDRSHQSQR